MSDKEAKIDKVLDILYALNESAEKGVSGARGTMANLRNTLVDAKKHRAWPALHRVGICPGDQVGAFIAGCFATYPCAHPRQQDNFGTTCCKIQTSRGESAGEKNGLTPTERRFQQVLSAECSEVQDRVLHLVKLAKASAVPVDYMQLWRDLTCWNDRVKMAWAASFWTPGRVSAGEEAE